MSTKKVRIIASVIAIFLALLLVFGFVADIFIFSTADAAQTVSGLNNKLSSLDSQKKKIEKELKAIENQKKSTLTKKDAIDKKIDITQQEIDTINSLISALDADISQTAKELDDAQKKEAERRELFLKRVRIMEEEGTASFLGIILSADSFSDMLTRTELIGDVVNSDKKLMRELADIRTGIEQKKAQLDQARSEQASAKSNLVSKQSSLNSQFKQANTLLSSLESEADKYEAAYEEAEKAQAAARSALKKLLASQSNKNTAYVGGAMLWPTAATIITSSYGSRRDPITGKTRFHTGVDISASGALGMSIYAANSGTVIVAGWSSKGYGNYVVIDHGGGKSTLYGHMSKILTSKGAKVSRGDVIGKIGSTGYSTGPHLHFEVLINGDHTNPMPYLKG